MKVPYEFNAEHLSRWMAYVLRHNPSRYRLQPDPHGYINFEDFFLIAKRRYPDVSPEQLRELIATMNPDRFEVTTERLRARYGHSIPVVPPGPPVEPPAQLYHGLDSGRLSAVLAEGLKPMERCLLHLSITLEDALAVARRKTEQPSLVRIHAQEAHRAGIAFYREGPLYLASHIPSALLSVEPVPASLSQRQNPPCEV